MPEITFVLTGKPKRGPLPPLKRMDAKEAAETGSEPKKPGITMVDASTKEKPAGKMTQDEAGFWNESAPRICETCGYREEGGCRKVDGVDWEECDQTLSGCSKWEAEGAEEDEGEAEEDEE